MLKIIIIRYALDTDVASYTQKAGNLANILGNDELI